MMDHNKTRELAIKEGRTVIQLIVKKQSDQSIFRERFWIEEKLKEIEWEFI